MLLDSLLGTNLFDSLGLEGHGLLAGGGLHKSRLEVEGSQLIALGHALTKAQGIVLNGCYTDCYPVRVGPMLGTQCSSHTHKVVSLHLP